MKQYFYSADVLLPRFHSNPERMQKWACIACDQYTSEPDYWERVENEVGKAESTLDLILPEIRLDEADNLIPKINSNMEEYLGDCLESFPNSMIYVERTLKNGKVRRGIVGAVDLEEYDYNAGATSLIRATEKTVLERIPSRVKIREGAAIELPHIMILIDDKEHRVIEPLSDNTFDVAYDFDLMECSGHIKGMFIPEDEQGRIVNSLSDLADGDNPLLFAMGDGNHSLAAAKAFWEELKGNLTKDEAENHPARYALCEVVNIHDTALEFEPIYRVIFGADPENLMKELEKYSNSLPKNNLAPQTVTVLTTSGEVKTVFENPTSALPVGTLQAFLDIYVKRFGGKIDYIHGEDSVKKLISKDSVGFIFKGMEKSELFPTVIADGALVRKTFSMGEADDKRFYLEARKIKM